MWRFGATPDMASTHTESYGKVSLSLRPFWMRKQRAFHYIAKRLSYCSANSRYLEQLWTITGVHTVSRDAHSEKKVKSTERMLRFPLNSAMPVNWRASIECAVRGAHRSERKVIGRGGQLRAAKTKQWPLILLNSLCMLTMPLTRRECINLKTKKSKVGRVYMKLNLKLQSEMFAILNLNLHIYYQRRACSWMQALISPASMRRSSESRPSGRSSGLCCFTRERCEPRCGTRGRRFQWTFSLDILCLNLLPMNSLPKNCLPSPHEHLSASEGSRERRNFEVARLS